MKRLSPGGQIKDVRADHIHRYRWAAERLQGTVIDAGCGSGYGAAILADAGLAVLAIDAFADGLHFGAENYDRPGIEWRLGDLETCDLPRRDAAVAFEVIEHLARPERLLQRLDASVLLASVPNEAVWPWEPRLAHAHHRHYTREDLEELLGRCGWEPVTWWGQRDGFAPVEPEMHGRTLIVEARWTS